MRIQGISGLLQSEGHFYVLMSPNLPPVTLFARAINPEVQNQLKVHQNNIIETNGKGWLGELFLILNTDMKKVDEVVKKKKDSDMDEEENRSHEESNDEVETNRAQRKYKYVKKVDAKVTKKAKQIDVGNSDIDENEEENHTDEDAREKNNNFNDDSNDEETLFTQAWGRKHEKETDDALEDEEKSVKKGNNNNNKKKSVRPEGPKPRAQKRKHQQVEYGEDEEKKRTKKKLKIH